MAFKVPHGWLPCLLYPDIQGIACIYCTGLLFQRRLGAKDLAVRQMFCVRFIFLYWVQMSFYTLSEEYISFVDEEDTSTGEWPMIVELKTRKEEVNNNKKTLLLRVSKPPIHRSKWGVSRYYTAFPAFKPACIDVSPATSYTANTVPVPWHLPSQDLVASHPAQPSPISPIGTSFP